MYSIGKSDMLSAEYCCLLSALTAGPGASHAEEEPPESGPIRHLSACHTNSSGTPP